MFARSRLVAALLSLSILPACASSTSIRTGFGGPTAEGFGAIDVVNRTWDDVTVYLVRDTGSPIRLGRVDAFARARLDVPAGLIVGASLQLQATHGNGQRSLLQGYMDPTGWTIARSASSDLPYISLPFNASAETPVRWVIHADRPVSDVMMSQAASR